MRGGIGQFCDNCFKCFKRKLIRLTIENKKITDDNLDELFNMIENEIKKPRYDKTLETIYEIGKLNVVLLLTCLFYQENNEQKNNHINPIINSKNNSIIKRSNINDTYSKNYKIIETIKNNFGNNISNSQYLFKWNNKSKPLLDLKYYDYFLNNLKFFQYD